MINNDKELNQKIQQRLKSGMSVRQIADDLNIPRTEVQKQVNQLKKNKSKRFWIYFIPAIFVIVVLILILQSKPQAQIDNFQQHTETEESWLRNFRSITHQIISKKTDDRWLFEKVTEDDIPRLVALGKYITKQIELGLEKNSSIPKVKEMKEIFAKNLYVSYFDDASGGSVQFSMETTKIPSDSDQEVVFYGKNSSTHSMIDDHPLFYDKEWRALVIGAMDWDDIWFQAVTLHELYHAKMYRDGAPSSVSPPMSNLYIQEEVSAHNLEHEILNLQTGGKYNKIVKEILNSKKAGNQKELIEQITAEDLILLDGLFGVGRSRETGIRLTQFYFSLLNEWVDRQFKQEDRAKEKSYNYRLIVSTGDNYGS